MLLGLRGVGKTVLLNRISEMAEGLGHEVVQLEAPEGQPLHDGGADIEPEALGRNFFRVRLDRQTPREQDYPRAMAEVGPGPHRSGAIAEIPGRSVGNTGALRAGLIRKGMLRSPAHGATAFTVPPFDQFMRRAVPSWHPTERRGKGDRS